MVTDDLFTESLSEVLYRAQSVLGQIFEHLIRLDCKPLERSTSNTIDKDIKTGPLDQGKYCRQTCLPKRRRETDLALDETSDGGKTCLRGRRVLRKLFH